MFTFKSPANPNNSWKLCFRDRAEMNKIYYESRPVDEETRIHGITEYVSQTVYIDKDLDGFPLTKVLRHELTHIYLWETGQQDSVRNEEETCDLIFEVVNNEERGIYTYLEYMTIMILTLGMEVIVLFRKKEEVNEEK
jgi:hypothetical protein